MPPNSLRMISPLEDTTKVELHPTSTPMYSTVPLFMVYGLWMVDAEEGNGRSWMMEGVIMGRWKELETEDQGSSTAHVCVYIH